MTFFLLGEDGFLRDVIEGAPRWVEVPIQVTPETPKQKEGMAVFVFK